MLAIDQVQRKDRLRHRSGAMFVPNVAARLGCLGTQQQRHDCRAVE